MKCTRLAAAVISSLLVLGLASGLMGCGSGNHASPAGSGFGGGGGTVPVSGTAFAYVANTTTNSITAFRVDNTTGTLISVPGSPFSAGGTTPGRIAVSTSAQLLFVINRGSGTIASHQVERTTGVLTIGSTANTGSLPVDIVLSPIANFVYVLNSDGTISGYSFDAVGFMTPLPGSPFPVGTNGAGAKEITTDSAGRFLLVTVQAGVEIFQIAADGLLSIMNLPRANVGAQPTGVAVVPGRNLVYSTDAISGQIFGTNFLPGSGLNTGLTPLPGSPMQAGTNPVFISITPTGTFAYVGGGVAGSGTIQAFAIGATGLLTPIVGSFTAPFGVTQLAIDPSGQFLYAASVNPSATSNNTGALSAYLINQNTGVLTTVPGSPFSVTSPGGVTVARF